MTDRIESALLLLLEEMSGDSVHLAERLNGQWKNGNVREALIEIAAKSLWEAWKLQMKGQPQ